MNWPVQSEAGEILRNALIRLLNANIKVCATVHDSFLIECQLPELNEQIRIAKQCMIDAGTYIVGAEGMQVDVEIHRGNFKPEPADQELFNLIFEEIEKYKTSQKLNQGQVTYPNKVRSIYI
jgi:hypothetical protein